MAWALTALLLAQAGATEEPGSVRPSTYHGTLYDGQGEGSGGGSATANGSLSEDGGERWGSSLSSLILSPRLHILEQQSSPGLHLSDFLLGKADTPV